RLRVRRAWATVDVRARVPAHDGPAHRGVRWPGRTAARTWPADRLEELLEGRQGRVGQQPVLAGLQRAVGRAEETQRRVRPVHPRQESVPVRELLPGVDEG